MHLILFLLATLAVVFLPIGKNEYYNNIRRRKVAIITAMGTTPILTFVTFGSKAAVSTTYVVIILIATIVILCAGWLRYDNKKSNREENNSRSIIHIQHQYRESNHCKKTKKRVKAYFTHALRKLKVPYHSVCCAETQAPHLPKDSSLATLIDGTASILWLTGYWDSKSKREIYLEMLEYAALFKHNTSVKSEMRPYLLFSYGVVLLALCIAGILPILPSVGSFLLVAWLSKHFIVREYWLVDTYIAQSGYAKELLQEYDIINEGTSLSENNSFISKLTHISMLDIGLPTLRHLNTLNAIYNK